MRAARVSRRFVVVLAVGAGPLAGCNSGPPPVYDDNIGVQAVPADPGSLAGTFALKTVNTTLVHVPVLGDYAGGGENLRLVTRTWDEASGTYAQSSLLCGGFNYEVAGVTTSAPASTYRAVPPSTHELVVIDHATGTYAATGHLQLWGLQNLDDPLHDALPVDATQAAEEPFASQIYDMDHDDNPGATTFVSGAVDGEIYLVQRKTVDLDGIIVGPDHAMGLAHNTNEVVQLGNNNALLARQNEGAAEPHPDPKRSYFDEVRIADGATCDDVIAADADGTLPRLRPF